MASVHAQKFPSPKYIKRDKKKAMILTGGATRVVADSLIPDAIPPPRRGRRVKEKEEEDVVVSTVEEEGGEENCDARGEEGEVSRGIEEDLLESFPKDKEDSYCQNDHSQDDDGKSLSGPDIIVDLKSTKTLAELRKICNDRNISSSGRKQDLVERIMKLEASPFTLGSYCSK